MKKENIEVPNGSVDRDAPWGTVLVGRHRLETEHHPDPARSLLAGWQVSPEGRRAQSRRAVGVRNAKV